MLKTFKTMSKAGEKEQERFNKIKVHELGKSAKESGHAAGNHINLEPFVEGSSSRVHQVG